MSTLADDIASLVARGEHADKAEAREAFTRLRTALSSGEIRAAEPDREGIAGWRVNTWVKQGILLGVRAVEIADV